MLRGNNYFFMFQFIISKFVLMYHFRVHFHHFQNRICAKIWLDEWDKNRYILERKKTYFSLCERVFKIDNGWKKNKFIHDKMQI